MKKLMKKMIILGLFMVFASSMLVGCGRTEGGASKEGRKEKAIVGKWKEVGGSSTIEFFNEGIVTVADEGDPTLAGKYRFIDDNRIIIDIALFGNISIVVEISSSTDEITLVNPFGKVEKYRKLRQIGEATKSNIAGDYTIITITPDGKEIKLSCLSTWREDGTVVNNFTGEWKTRDNRLEIRGINGEDMMLFGGRITSDALHREFPAIILTKQKNARVIKKLETGNILWSDYSFTGGRSNMIKSSSLEIKEDGAFREIVLIRNMWRIKDGKNGIVEITTIDENQRKKKLKGKIEGDTIIFKNSGAETRFVMAGDIGETKNIPANSRSSAFYDIAEQQRKKEKTIYGQTREQKFFAKPVPVEESVDKMKKETISAEKEETKPKTFHDVSGGSYEGITTGPVPSTEPNFKKLSKEDEIEAKRLWESVIECPKGKRAPAFVYKQAVDKYREIIRRWPESAYAFMAKRALANIPGRYRKMDSR